MSAFQGLGLGEGLGIGGASFRVQGQGLGSSCGSKSEEPRRDIRYKLTKPSAYNHVSRLLSCYRLISSIAGACSSTSPAHFL